MAPPERAKDTHGHLLCKCAWVSNIGSGPHSEGKIVFRSCACSGRCTQAKGVCLTNCSALCALLGIEGEDKADYRHVYFSKQCRDHLYYTIRTFRKQFNELGLAARAARAVERVNAEVDELEAAMLVPEVAPQQAAAPEVAPQQAAAPEVASQQAATPEVAPQMAEAPEVAAQMAMAPEVAAQMAAAPEVAPQMAEAPEVAAQMAAPVAALWPSVKQRMKALRKVSQLSCKWEVRAVACLLHGVRDVSNSA